MKAVLLDACYLTSSRGSILATCWRPATPARRSVLLVPPFAEEMNKTRRMFSCLAQALAEFGIASVLPDLFGTGDSEGDFRDADWACWQADLAEAAAWAQRTVAPVECQVAVRLGACLAADASEAGLLPAFLHTVLWQPVFDRSRHLTQFLRLRTAATLSQHDRKETVEQLKQRLAAGESLEVAGYELSSSLARDMVAASHRVILPEGWGGIHWMETQREQNAPLSQSARIQVDANHAGGRHIEACTIAGEPFWSTTEITTNPLMIERTVEILSR